MKLGYSKYGWLLLGLLITGLSVVGPASAAGPKPTGKGTPAAKAEPAPPQKKLGPAPDKATSAKVNAYIELLNEESENLNRARHDWLSKIAPDKEPTCKEDVSIEQAIGPDGGRYDAYRKKLKAKPALAPDAAALRMVDAVEELRKLGQEPGPHTEYQGRSQPDVWCKKLKDTHPRLVAIFSKYKQGEREVRDYVDNFTDERDQREVQTTLKTYGKHYRYQFAVLTLEGKSMMRAIGVELGKEAPDAAAIKQKFDSYFALTDEIKGMMDKEPSKQKTEPYPNPFKFFLIESVPKIKRASTTLLEALAQKPDKKRDERVQSAWKSVIAGYNDMIDYMNQVHFEKTQK